MKYALLIYADEREWENATEEELRAVYERYDAFTREALERGMMVGGEQLKDTASASTVTVRDGETITTDGPYAETKEQLGGFYLLECRDLDEAIEMAAKIPAASRGSIEVRPVVERPQSPQ